MGPPQIVKDTDDGVAAWDKATDGLIGNGSKVIVKFSVWEDKICEMLAIKVVEHVKYEPSANDGGF
jgi:formate-dependent phosphoribosylglycinamide formyltransferase (GAR transformylase)